LTSQGAVVPIAASREVLGSSHSAILIYSVVRNCIGSHKGELTFALEQLECDQGE
jgi:hypothetical protein